MIVLLARPQQHRREVGLIDRVGPVLGLQAETAVLRVDRSTLALQGAIQEVARVKLDSRLGGVHLQDPPAAAMMHPGDKDRPPEGPGGTGGSEG